MGVLDLSGADTSGFDAIPSGRYAASVFEVKMAETKGGPDAKVPEGTPLMKFHWQVHERLDDPSDETDYENRRLFSQYIIPPKDYDKEKAAKMKGMLVRLLVALGYDEEEVQKKGFDLDLEDLVGRPAVLSVGQKPSYNDPETMENEIKGVKPEGSGAPAEAGLI